MTDSVFGTSNIWPYYHANNTSGSPKGQGNTLGKDEFLKILIAQIRNQDPMQPLQDKDFIAQMAQFTSVEQLVLLSSEFKKFTNSIGFASALIGKHISWETESLHGADPVIRSGIVQSVAVTDGEAFAVVDGERIAVSRILEVRNAAEEPQDEDDQPPQDGDDAP